MRTQRNVNQPFQAFIPPTNSHIPSVKPISLIIVDDHCLLRENWRFIFNRDARFSVMADCSSAEEAIELVKLYRPDVIMMDINLPGMNGIEATAWIRLHSPTTQIVGVSLHAKPGYARKMMQQGAVGYVTKNSSREELFQALIDAATGKKHICNEIKDLLSVQMMENDTDQAQSLSKREVEILSHVKIGKSSKEIAGMLAISCKTVEVHRHNILRKLNLKNTAALVNYINHSPELEMKME